jgi:hypothetical protein
VSLEQDTADVRDAVTRQPGCTDKECSVCSANKRRCEAAERVIAAAERAEDANRRMLRAVAILNDGFKAPEVMRELAIEVLTPELGGST